MARKLKLLVDVQTGDPDRGQPASYTAGQVVEETAFKPGLVAHWESWGGVFEVAPEEEARDAAGRFTAKKEA